MHAVVIKKTKAATVGELHLELARLEHALMVAQRGNAQARTDLPALIAQGDSEGIADCRKRIRTTACDVTALTEDREFLQGALAKAQDLARHEGNVAKFANIRAELTALVKHASACEDNGSAKALGKVRAARQAVADAINASGVPADELQHLFTDLQIVNIYGWQEWLASDGAIGRGPGLLSPMELKASGRASLRIQSNEFLGVALRVVRGALGIAEGEVTP